MNNKYGAVMMAEPPSSFASYECDRTLFSQHDNNCLQHHVYQQQQQRPTYNEVPTSSLGFNNNNQLNANVRAKCRPPSEKRLFFYLYVIFSHTDGTHLC